MRLVDSHVHVCEYREPGALVAHAEAGGWVLFSCGVDEATSLRTLELAHSHGGAVKAFVGVHPSEAEKSARLGWLEGALGRASGLGEVGLDPKYSSVSQDSTQAGVLREQLRLAQKSGKGVQIHSRGAESRVLDELEAHTLGGVLMHWFQDQALLKEVLDRGYLVSFGPSLISSKKLQRMAAAAGPSRTVVESDGPVGFVSLGGQGGPFLVPSVVFRLAELWGVRFDEALGAVNSNALNFLGNKKG